MCKQYSTSKGDYFYICDDGMGETYTEWQLVGSPTFSPQPKTHAVPVPGTLALMLIALAAWKLTRKVIAA